MAPAIRVGIAGAGWPAHRHAEGYRAAGGFELVAVADPIASRRAGLATQFGINRQIAAAEDLVKDADIDLLSVCLPNDLHAPIAIAALRAGKHVVCESPPALSHAEARRIAAAADKSGKTLLYAMQRRFGAAEQAARQVIEKGFVGEPRHVRVSWMRTRGTPAGTGWYSDKSRSGGGVLLDLGAPMLDLGWHLLGQPEPQSVFAVTTTQSGSGVETAVFAMLRFAGDKSVELQASWVLNQPPKLQGTLCRVHADDGAIDLHTSRGPLLYRKFDEKGEAKETPLKLPKTVHYAAMMRHLKRCIAGHEQPLIGPTQGAAVMRMIDAIYKSAASGRSETLATQRSVCPTGGLPAWPAPSC